MSKIKSILAFVALMLCGGAWAAVDLTGADVYWDHDFGVTSKVGRATGYTYTFNINGNTLQDDGTFKITSTTGGLVDVSDGSAAAWTVLIKYRNLKAISDHRSVLLTMRNGNSVLDMGMASSETGATSLIAFYNGDGRNWQWNKNATPDMTAPESGYAQYAYNGGANHWAGVAETIPSSNGANSADGFSFSNQTAAKGFAIGGPRADPETSGCHYGAWDDLEIEAVAIWKGSYVAFNAGGNGNTIFPSAATDVYAKVDGTAVNFADLAWKDSFEDGATDAEGPTSSAKNANIKASADTTITFAAAATMNEMRVSGGHKLTFTTTNLPTVSKVVVDEDSSIKLVTAKGNGTQGWTAPITGGGTLEINPTGGWFLFNGYGYDIGKLKVDITTNTHYLYVGTEARPVFAENHRPNLSMTASNDHDNSAMILAENTRTYPLYVKNLTGDNKIRVRSDMGNSANNWVRWLDTLQTEETTFAGKFVNCSGRQPGLKVRGNAENKHKALTISNTNNASGGDLQVVDYGKVVMTGKWAGPVTVDGTSILELNTSSTIASATLSAGATLKLGKTTSMIAGDLTLADGVVLIFPESLTAGTAVTLCNGTLTPPTRTTDVVAWVGDIQKVVNLVFDAENKTVSYTVVREPGDVYWSKAANFEWGASEAGTFSYFDDQEEKHSTALLNGDTIVIAPTKAGVTADQGKCYMGPGFAGHTIRIDEDVSFCLYDSTYNIPANMDVEISRNKTLSIWVGGTWASESHIKDGVNIHGEGTVEISGTTLIDGEVAIACTVSNPSNTIKINTDGVLKVPVDANIGTIASAVSNKYVVRTTTNGYTTYSLSDTAPIAEVGNTDYLTIADAIAAAEAQAIAQDKVTVTLKSAVTANINIPANVIVDLKSFVLTGAVTGAGTIKLPGMPTDAQATAYAFTSTAWTGTVEVAAIVENGSGSTQYKLEKLGNAGSAIIWNGDSGTKGKWLTGGTDNKVAAKIILAGDLYFNQGSSNANYYLGEIDGNNDADCDVSFLTWRNNDGVGASYHVDKLSNFAGKITATRYTTISELALNAMPTANQKILTFGTPNDSYHTSKDSFAITSITVNGEVKDLAYEIRQDDGVYIVAVAQVGDNTYLSFAEAFEAAGEGGTVKLAGNTSAPISIPAGKKIDLNGYILSGTITYGEGAYLVENGKPKINGCATNFDLTFDGNTTIDYTTVGGTVGLNGTASYKANNQAISLLNRPWVDNAGSYFNANQLSLAMAGVMPASNNRIFMHIGGAKAGYYGVYLATGTKDNEVIIGWNEGTTGHTIDTMIVPNARSERHCYIITKDDETIDGVTTATFTIYLDGLKWKTFVPDEYFRISGGIQVGSCYWQLVSGYNFADGNDSYVNFFRAYQRIISKAEIDAYAEAYPYTSPNGTYEREIAEDGNWVAENAWSIGEETTNKPASNGNVVVTATHAEEAEATAKTITVNLDDIVEYEKLTLSGDPMIFKRANDAAKEIKSVCTVVGADVTIGEKTIDLTAGPTIVVDGGKLKFDFSRLPAVAVAEEHQGVMTEVVTGEIDQQPNGVVTVIRPTDADIKSAELVYNRNHYEIVIRNYAAKIVGETTQYFDTLDDALEVALADTSKIVTILDGTTELPEEYVDSCVVEDGRAWAKREVYARATSPYTYHAENNDQESTKITLRAGDTIVIDQAIWSAGGNGWNMSNLESGYPIKIVRETDIGATQSIPADQHITITYKSYPQASDKKGVYLKGDIGSNVNIDGSGALFLGMVDNKTIADGVTISCDVGFQSSGKHQVVVANATVTFNGTYNHIAGSSIKINDGSKLVVREQLPDGAVESNVEGRSVVWDEETKTYELGVATAFEAVPGSSASGWFTDWGGEKTGAARSVVTGNGVESFRMVHHDGDAEANKWHPYRGNVTAKNAYTMSVYGTADLVVPETGKYKVLWSFGQNGNAHVLAKDGDGNIVFCKKANGTVSNIISAGKISGYHLITVTFSTTSGSAIWIDGEKKASDATLTTAANDGLQIGAIYSGTYAPMMQGIGFVPTYIWAAEAIAPDAQIAALSAAHPAATTFDTNVEFDTNGGKLYLPSLSNTAGNLFRVKKGTLIVPSSVTATLDNIEFGDNGDSHNYGLDLDGTLNISKNSSGNCTSGDIYRQNNQNDGIVFSEWTGTGTYNIRGTFNAPNAYAELVHSSNSQPTSIFNVDGGTFTVKGITAAVTEKATINLTNGGILDLGSHPSDQSIRIIKNLTNGTVNGNGDEYDTLNVTGAVSFKYGSQHIRSLNIANGGTAKLITNNDQLNYAAVVAHVKGTLDCGTTRQTLFDGSKIYLYNGGTITGTGSESNGVTVALDTDRGDTGIVLVKNEDNDSKVATLSAPIGAHDANSGSNTITVQEGTEDVILSIPNAASLNGCMPWVIGEGVNVKFGNDKSLGAYTSLTINGNVVLDENVTEETTLVTVAEGKTITLGAGVKAVDPSLNELTRTVLAVEGLSLVAKTGETLITIDGNEYVSIDVALHHLLQGSTVVLGADVTLVDGIIHHGDQTFNPLDYLGYEIVVDPETQAMTASRVFEDSSEVGLMISEICPKVSAWDENHCDAGWLEVVNTSKKWVQFKDYSFARFNRGKEVKKLTDWKNNVTKALAPGERLVIKTSEEYPKADDKSVTQYGEDLGSVIVLAAKVNPKKYPLVILTKGGKAKQNCVVPVDVPEDKSVCYDGAKLNGAIVSYITTASKGEASNFTGAVAVGPQITSLYAVKDAPDPWIAFPQATVGSDYTVTLPVNPVYGGNANNAIESVKLIYRIDYNNEVVVDTLMTKVSTDAVNGDMYTGTIPGTALTADGQLVRWAVKITDVGGNEWRSPSFNNPEDGFEYYGTITTPTEDQLSGGLNTMHLFADPDEVADGIGTQNTKGGNCLMNRDADDANYKTTRHPYGAYVGIYDSETGKYYDKVRIDKRGRTTGTMTKKAHGLKFAKAQPFIGTDALTGETIECRKSSFTAEFGDPTFIRQELAFEVMRRNGVKAPFHYPVRLNLNGQFYQLAFHSERFSDELIEDFYGLDGKGYGYKNVGPFHNGTNNSSERKTPDDGTPDQTTNDPVLKAFCDTLNGAGSINENTDFSSINEFSADLSKVVAKSFDLPAWINYMAATKITAETDDTWANISAYYDVNGTGAWMPLAYDMNQSLGQWHFADDRNRGRIGLVADIDNFKSHPFYGGLHIRMHKISGEASGNPNYAYEAIFQNAKYRRLFLRRLRTIMDKEIGATAAATQAKETSALFTSATAMVAKINDLGLEDRKIWTDYANVDFENNTDRSGNGSADKIWVWNREMTENLRTPEGGLADFWTNYVKPRRAYLYGKHLASNATEDFPVGYGLTKSAGIPDAQSPIENLVNGIDATYNETLGVIVISNTNGEAVDMSGWELRGPIAMTLPMGTVIDQGTNETPATLYVTADRKALVTSLGDSIGDQLIVGNGTANAVDAPISLRTDAGVRVVGEPTAQELYLRVWGFSGQPNDCNDEGGEFVILTNIGEEELDASGAIFHSLKAGTDPTTDSRCKIVLPPGTMIAAGATLRLNQDVNGELAWEKMTDGDLDITLYDSFGSPIQSWKTLTQKSIDGVSVKGTGKYAKYDFDNEAWTTDDIENSPGHWFEGSTVSGAHLACIYIQAMSDKAITFDNPTMKGKSRIKISGTATVTIDGTLTMSGVSTGIKSAGNLVFTDGSYTITASDDCIQADGDITINGGTFICHSTGNDGIDANQNIVINGGTIFAFTAATETDGNKSTGLDVNEGHSITINGGTVIATSLEAAALNALDVKGSQAAKVVEVTGLTADEAKTIAIADILVPFPAMTTVPTAVLVSKPGMTDGSTVVVEEEAPGTVEIVAGNVETDTAAVHATVPASWKSHAAVTAGTITEKQAAEAFVLGLAEPTEKPMVSSEQTTEADSIRIVDNVAPRFGTGVTVKRTLFVGTTPGEEAADNTIEETDGGFTVPLPKGSEPKVKYIKIKYSFK